MKKEYEAPEVQVIEMEVQGPVMDPTGNTVKPLGDYGNGGDGFTY